MAYTSTIRKWYADYFKKGYDLRIVFLGRADVKAYSPFYDAWVALDQTLTNMGYGTAAIVSTYYPRYITGTTKWSLHSYSGVALDIDPFSKGNDFVKGTSWDFSHTKFTREQVLAALAIRTVGGFRVWRWGGDFGDYMHWQLDCPPEELLKGIDWSTVVGDGHVPPEIGDEVMFKDGDKGQAVVELQKALLSYNAAFLPKYGADGDFGDETASAVRQVQADHDLIETGVVDLKTQFVLTPAQVGSALTGDGGVAELVDQVNAIEASLDDTQAKLRSV